jgi:hypothetical protein
MNIYIPKDFSEEKCPPERTIIIPSRDKVLEEFSNLLEKENLQRPEYPIDSFSFLNAKSIYVVTSVQPFKYIKLLCEDRSVHDYFWVTDTFSRKREEEEVEEIVPVKIVRHWNLDLDLLKKKLARMKPIIIVVVVYLVSMLFFKGLLRGPTRLLIRK